MYDPRFMRRRERVGDLHSVAQRLVDSEPMRADQVGERLAGDVLHHHVILIVHREDVVDGDDVGMIQAACRARFPDKAPPAVRIRHRGAGENLDRHLAIEARIARFEDLSHAARAQPLDDLVMRNRPADHK